MTPRSGDATLPDQAYEIVVIETVMRVYRAEVPTEADARERPDRWVEQHSRVLHAETPVVLHLGRAGRC